MELEASLPCYQEPAIYSQPKADQSNPIHAHHHSISWRSSLTLSCHLRLDLPSGSFPQAPCA